MATPSPCPTEAGLFTEVHALRGDDSYALAIFPDNTCKEGIATGGKLKKARKFLYRHEGDDFFILDPRLRLIVGSYVISTLSEDSLVLTNPKKSCDESAFVRMNAP